MPEKNEIVARLRASRLEHHRAEVDRGRAAGAEWAGRAKGAEYDELKWLSDHKEDAADALFTWEFGNESPFDRNHEFRDFWGDVVGVEDPSAAFVEGFTRGALHVWDSVADEVER